MRGRWIAGTTAVIGLSLLAAVSAGQGDGPRRGGDGGHNTAPGDPLPGLTADESARFDAGEGQFLEVETPEGGLGPVFNDNSCVACHGAGGTGGAGDRLVTRFGRIIDDTYDPMIAFGGPLIQSRGIGAFHGVNFVGEVVPAEATIVAHRRTTPLFGLGLIEGIPESALIANAQQQARWSPATAGAVNHVVEIGVGRRAGRFGWKAQHATLFAFAADAYHNELGVTSPLLPDENAPQGDGTLLAANPALANPNDDSDDPIDALADFIALLAPPARGNIGPRERAGEGLFAAIGCASCHRPTWQTGPSPVRALSNVRFSPYSDFLLHPMGRLADGIAQEEAGPSQFRTPPLWGLRHQPTFLHDGRAPTAESAILLHDGQGLRARNAFANLRRPQKDQVIAFLNSL